MAFLPKNLVSANIPITLGRQSQKSVVWIFKAKGSHVIGMDRLHPGRALLGYSDKCSAFRRPRDSSANVSPEWSNLE